MVKVAANRPAEDARAAIAAGHTWLGIEMGSTRIKACLIGPDHEVLATGGHEWENQLVDGRWTYALDAVWAGLQNAVADLLAHAERQHGVRPASVGALGISAMMHGYLAFDADGELLVPFRTWRNTSTGRAAAELSERFGFNIPQRWSIAHFYQAILDDEPHVPRVAFLTTLAGYVHWRLTGRKVLGVGDASGMFPIDPATKDYDARMLGAFDGVVAARRPGTVLKDLLPLVLPAGAEAGALTAEGAALLDPAGTLKGGIPLCPPEGDAGTGMVATNSVVPRTGNVSAGTSIFAMVVLEKPLASLHREINIVTTPGRRPGGDGALQQWLQRSRGVGGLVRRVRRGVRPACGVRRSVRRPVPRCPGRAGPTRVACWPTITWPASRLLGLDKGCPLVVRTPGSALTLANFMRAQLLGSFGTLSLGMRVLADEGVRLDAMLAHGGVFRTAGVAQRLLAAALGAPVAVGRTAGEGGAWGMAVLAAYLGAADEADLGTYLGTRVFANAAVDVVEPGPGDVAGFTAFLERYSAGLAVERAATEALR